MFALPLLTFKITGSALSLALVVAFEYVPYLLFGLVIGAGVDRVDRRRLMVAVSVAQAGVISIVPLLASVDLLSIWWVYAVGFASSTLWIVFSTAEFAVVPGLVGEGDLVAANGRLQASYSAATVAGPLLAGLLVSVVPVHAVLLVDAASFLACAILLARIKTSFDGVAGESRRPARLRAEVAEGLRYVIENPVLRNVCLMMAVINCVGFTVYAQLALFAKERLGASDARVALLYAAGGVGMILLALAAGPLRRRMSFNKLALGTLMAGGLLIVLLALASDYWIAVLLWASIWGLVVLFDINSNSLCQSIVPGRLLGRVQSVITVLSWSAIPLGTLAGGAIIERTGNVALVYGTIGVTIFLVALGSSFTSLGRADPQDMKLPPKEAAGG